MIFKEGDIVRDLDLGCIWEVVRCYDNSVGVTIFGEEYHLGRWFEKDRIMHAFKLYPNTSLFRRLYPNAVVENNFLKISKK